MKSINVIILIGLFGFLIDAAPQNFPPNPFSNPNPGPPPPSNPNSPNGPPLVGLAQFPPGQKPPPGPPKNPEHGPFNSGHHLGQQNGNPNKPQQGANPFTPGQNLPQSPNPVFGPNPGNTPGPNPPLNPKPGQNNPPPPQGSLFGQQPNGQPPPNNGGFPNNGQTPPVNPSNQNINGQPSGQQNGGPNNPQQGENPSPPGQNPPQHQHPVFGQNPGHMPGPNPPQGQQPGPCPEGFKLLPNGKCGCKPGQLLRNNRCEFLPFSQQPNGQSPPPQNGQLSPNPPSAPPPPPPQGQAKPPPTIIHAQNPPPGTGPNGNQENKEQQQVPEFASPETEQILGSYRPPPVRPSKPVTPLKPGRKTGIKIWNYERDENGHRLYYETYDGTKVSDNAGMFACKADPTKGCRVTWGFSEYTSPEKILIRSEFIADEDGKRENLFQQQLD